MVPEAGPEQEEQEQPHEQHMPPELTAAEERDIEEHWARDLRHLVGLFLAALAVLAFLAWYLLLRRLDDSVRAQLEFPNTFQKVQQLGSVLVLIRETHYYTLLFLHGYLYLMIQTFAIPGSFICNLLAGAVFSMWVGFPLTVLYNTIGSTLCFAASRRFARRVILHHLAARVAQLRATIAEHDEDMCKYLTSLFLFPFVPHWFIKAAVPHLHVTYRQFVPAVTFGIIPYNWICCQAGAMLSEFSSSKEFMNTRTQLQLVLMALLPLLPKLIEKVAPSLLPQSSSAPVKATKQL